MPRATKLKGSKIQLLGMKELNDIISRLPKFSQQRQVWRSTARSGSRPIIESVRSKMPRGKTNSQRNSGGTLKRSVKYRNFSSKFYNGLGGYVKSRVKPERGTYNATNPMTGAKYPKQIPFNNPAIDSVLIHGRKGGNDIKKKERNWYEEAARTQGASIMKKMSSDVSKHLQRQIKKLAK